MADIGAGGERKKHDKGKGAVACTSKTSRKKPEDIPDDHDTNFCDWRENNIVSSTVRNQGVHDICWSIAIASAVEAIWNKDNQHKRLKLSSQDLVNGVESDTKSLAMKKLGKVYHWISINGICEEDQVPYFGPRQKNLKKGRRQATLFITSYYEDGHEHYGANEKEMIKKLIHHPVVALLQPSKKLSNLQKDEIYIPPNNQPGEFLHAVLVIGFGTNNEGTDYFIIKNSEGTSWADCGFGKVIRKTSSGSNTSAFTNFSYPVEVYEKKK